MARKPLAERGLTVNEKKSVQIERMSTNGVVLVALIAAVISFVALRWMGTEWMGMTWYAPLLPIAVDGFGIICAFGIVRSQASGATARERVSEWVGLGMALALSIAANVVHALNFLNGFKPPAWLIVAFAAAIPTIVAFGIHVLGRALHNGVSSYVLADDPDKIHLDLAHLGDGPTVAAKAAPQPVARAAAATAKPAPAAKQDPAPAAASTTSTPATPAAQVPRPVDDDKARARALFDEAIAADPTSKPDASRIHDAAGVSGHKATTRRWVQSWWDEVGPDVAEAAAAADDAQMRDLAMTGQQEGPRRMVG